MTQGVKIINKRVEKKCGTCKQVKPLRYFPKKGGASPSLKSICKVCDNLRCAKRKRRIKWEKIYTKRKRQRKLNERIAIKEYINSFKITGCMVCGYNKCLSAIEFHHRNPQKKVKAISQCSSFSQVDKELPKCIALCANCHREVHAEILEV